MRRFLMLTTSLLLILASAVLAERAAAKPPSAATAHCSIIRDLRPTIDFAHFRCDTGSGYVQGNVLCRNSGSGMKGRSRTFYKVSGVPLSFNVSCFDTHRNLYDEWYATWGS